MLRILFLRRLPVQWFWEWVHVSHPHVDTIISRYTKLSCDPQVISTRKIPKCLLGEFGAPFSSLYCNQCEQNHCMQGSGSPWNQECWEFYRLETRVLHFSQMLTQAFALSCRTFDRTVLVLQCEQSPRLDLPSCCKYQSEVFWVVLIDYSTHLDRSLNSCKQLFLQSWRYWCLMEKIEMSMLLAILPVSVSVVINGSEMMP